MDLFTRSHYPSEQKYFQGFGRTQPRDAGKGPQGRVKEQKWYSTTTATLKVAQGLSKNDDWAKYFMCVERG